MIEEKNEGKYFLKERTIGQFGRMDQKKYRRNKNEKKRKKDLGTPQVSVLDERGENVTRAKPRRVAKRQDVCEEETFQNTNYQIKENWVCPN
jgi:uncharacterized protein YnzC (UPF0291/DUF896 family)